MQSCVQAALPRASRRSPCVSRPFRQGRNYPFLRGKENKVPEGSATRPRSLGQRRALPGRPGSPPYAAHVGQDPPSAASHGPATTVAPCPVEPGPVGEGASPSLGALTPISLSVP